MPASSYEQPMELEAALAVIDWKHAFARQLRLEAERLAETSDGAAVTVDQLRTALPAVMAATLAAIAAQTGERKDGKTQAA